MSAQLMHQLDDGLRQLVRFRSVLDAAGLPVGIEASASECIAVRFLHSNPVSQLQLGEYLGLEKSTVSRLVEALAAKGWVTKSPAPGNGRVRIVALTETGSKVARHIEQAMLLAHQRMIDKLTRDEQAALAIALPALVRVISELTSSAQHE